jgi:hypothetical protein
MHMITSERMMEEFIILMIISNGDYSVYMNSIAAVDEDFFEGIQFYIYISLSESN